MKRRPAGPAWSRAVAFCIFGSSLGVASLVACSSLTAPPEGELTAPAPPPKPSPSPSPTPAPAAPEMAAPNGEPARITASHILVAYKGAMRAAPTVTRSKDEAKKLAEQLARKAKSGSDFAELAKKSSDDTGSGARGGSLGSFGRTAMVKPFADAAFALKPGEVSGVVESDFGFHIIKRTE